MEPEKIQKELENLRKQYQEIINQEKVTREEMNEARAILFLTGQLYCEEIAVGAIERRLHLLPGKPTLIEFFLLIDGESEMLEEYRRHHLFNKLEQFYRIIKTYKNKYLGGKYYLEEEKFLKRYQEMSPNPEMWIGYKGDFTKEK
ncbi:MAG: hypothetical protein NT085_05655 [candidate division SR1 bacterium]|nr:hypothetical protein [candidate division SR1 bacterium]